MLPVMVPYPAAPLMPGLSPREVGAFVHHQAATRTAPLSEELQAFVGWVLELLVLPPASTPQLRNQLRIWQRQLQWTTSGYRLSWTEAFALYGLQF